MYVRKGSDVSLSQDLVSTFDHDYPFMRLAEVMFIYAEAANEVGHRDVAVDMLKQIRKRAGIEADRQFWMNVMWNFVLKGIVLWILEELVI